MAVKVNKSLFVRNVLNEIGAISLDPPEGWRKRVEEALERQNLNMHFTSIYKIRNDALAAAGTPNPNIRGKRKGKLKAKAVSVQSQSHPIVKEQKFSVQDLVAIKDFSKKFGGLDKFSEVINIIKSL